MIEAEACKDELLTDHIQGSLCLRHRGEGLAEAISVARASHQHEHWLLLAPRSHAKLRERLREALDARWLPIRQSAIVFLKLGAEDL